MSSPATISILMLPEPGHFLPTLGLATSLRRRGHTVRYVSLPCFQRFFVQHGFAFQPVLAHIFPDEPVTNLFETSKGLVSLGRLAAPRQTAGTPLDVLALLMPELRAQRSDLLLCDSLLNASRCEALTRELKTRGILLATQLGRGCHSSTLPEVVLCPRELEVPDDGPIQAGRYYAEPAVYRRRAADGFPWDWLDSGRSLVLGCLGTQCVDYPDAPRVMSAIVDAFDGLPSHQLVLATCGLDLPARAIPTNVLVVRSVPQLALLRRASLLITHGGLGSIKEAILARVPMIVIPFTYDQPANAARVTYHQLGTRLSPDACSPQAIRSLVQAMPGSNTRAGMSAMSAIFHRAESRPRAAHFIEACLSDGDAMPTP
jgi:UDP:flavonoid glycosyltransferase YjiC (YdhE family)